MAHISKAQNVHELITSSYCERGHLPAVLDVTTQMVFTFAEVRMILAGN